MITIKAEGIDDLLASLKGLERQIPYALANGVNAVARRVKAAATYRMQAAFDRPTPFVMNSLRLTPAKAPRNVEASVWFKDPPNLSQKDHFLLPQVEGGRRPLKPFEMGLGGRFVMPAGWMRAGNGLDLYGNLGRGQITKLLSASGGFHGSLRMNRTTGRNKADLFRLTKQRGKLMPGIYQRVTGDEAGGRMGRYLLARGLGAKKSELNKRYRSMYSRGIRPVVVFPDKAPTYRQRFDFYGIAQKVTDAHLRDEMGKAIDAEIQREFAYRARKGL